MATSTVADRARIMWCMRLSSAVRTAVACAIVGGATIYGPKFLAKFAAFSYLTAVLIVSDAALGDTLKGFWHAICATAQVVPLAVLGQWIIDPTAGVPVSVAALEAVLGAFAVALPECTHLTAKRIAFGQIVLVCSDAALGDGSSDGFMHPLYVGASTVLGASASVLALVFPYPGLACDKVQKLCRVYDENASERMNIYRKAFTTPENHTKTELIAQAKPLSETGAKLLESIRILQEGVRWERTWSGVGPGERLQSKELYMRGIEYSLVSSSPAFPIDQVIDHEEQLSDFLRGLSVRVEEKIKQGRCFSPSHIMKESETRKTREKPSFSLESISPLLGPVLFYFSCIVMFLNDTFAAQRELGTDGANTAFGIMKTIKTTIQKLFCIERLGFAVKCSLSLSLAILFGLIFDKENGCWAGLVIAISFINGRQAIFTIANTRAQGTPMGSVYGVICCFLFHREEVRLVALLPWIIFTSFLRCSKMYGQTGGVAAAIGALLILGRTNYGAPNDFALARLTEVFIGLSALIAVELCLQPMRAATLVRNHLCLTLNSLQECMIEMVIRLQQKDRTIPRFPELGEKQRKLSSNVCELKDFVAYAEMEPDFWFLPFPSSCYRKLVGSLSNIVDLLQLTAYNFEMLSEVAKKSTVSIEFKDLQQFQEALSSLQRYTEEAVSTESRANSEEPIDGNSRYLEAGKTQNTKKQTVLYTENKEAERISAEEDNKDNDKMREMIPCLGAIGFCLSSLMKELDDVEISKREIDQWEKHSSQ